MEIISTGFVAIHYDKTGRSVPSTGAVEVRSQTKIQFLEQRPPKKYSANLVRW